MSSNFLQKALRGAGFRLVAYCPRGQLYYKKLILVSFA